MHKLLVICGPTATGKTAIAVQLAKKLNGELVSADSRQVYVGMDIGTGKDRELLDGIPIWMYDVVRPDEEFSVSLYQSLASQALSDIWSRGKLPIVVGGTGFYIRSLIAPPDSLHVLPNIALRKTLANYTIGELQEKLHSLDPLTFKALNNSDSQNSRRLIRKIEIALSEDPVRTSFSLPTSLDTYTVGLTASLSTLSERISDRVEKRVGQGIVKEIESLLDHGYQWNLPSMSGLGYIQWRPFFEVINKEEIKKKIIQEWKHAEYQYTKRQITWFKKQKDIAWFDTEKLTFPEDVTTAVLAWYTDGAHEHKI